MRAIISIIIIARSRITLNGIPPFSWRRDNDGIVEIIGLLFLASTFLELSSASIVPSSLIVLNNIARRTTKCARRMYSSYTVRVAAAKEKLLASGVALRFKLLGSSRVQSQSSRSRKPQAVPQAVLDQALPISRSRFSISREAVFLAFGKRDRERERERERERKRGGQI